MCNKCKQSGARRIDKCMKKLCEFIDTHPNVKVIGSCCGHGKYPLSIVIKYKTGMDGKWKWKIKEMISDTEIPRTRKFYKKDKQGYYYIPEITEEDLK